MKNEFVPYDIALTMKELGFDELTLAAYVDNELEVGGIWKDSVKSKVIHKAPLYQQAFRWFREEHKLHSNIDIGFTDVDGLDYCLRKLIEIVKEKNYENN